MQTGHRISLSFLFLFSVVVVVSLVVLFVCFVVVVAVYFVFLLLFLLVLLCNTQPVEEINGACDFQLLRPGNR